MKLPILNRTNMKDWTFKTSLALLSLFAVIAPVRAQLELDFDLTPEEMAQNLVGVGVEIFNVQVSAADSSYAYYTSNATELGNSEGILLTTGRALNAVGPNDETGLPLVVGGNCLNCDLYDNGFPGSPLLTLANGGLTTWDAVTFEFDIVPQGDSISFGFTFASEEYLEWVGSSFNDVFGFFLSGPNIGTDVNIALIPGTSDAVAINSVNHISNTEYFFHNENPPGQGVQYDGFTLDLSASAGGLTPCEVYHIKLIIADGSDRLYDSAVFVNQISSNPIAITTSTVGGTDFMVEGCNDGTVQFESTFIPSDDLPVNFTLTGDAVYGVDYTTDPDLDLFFDPETEVYTLFIPAGESSITFDIFPIADGLDEISEAITISLVDQLCDGFLFQSSVDFVILDEIEASIDPPAVTICNGQCVTLTGSVLQEGTADFSWSPIDGIDDPSSLVIEVCPSTTTTYTLTSTLANCEVSASATVTVTEPNISFDVTNVTCVDGNSGAISATIGNATLPLTYEWTLDGNVISNAETLSDLEAGTYCLTIVDAEGCTSTSCTEVIEEDVLSISSAQLSSFLCANVSCDGACDGSIDIVVEGGTGSYSYLWLDSESNTVGTSASLTGLCAGSYTVTVTDELGCEVTGVYTLSAPSPLDIEVVGSVDVLCSGEETGVATVTSTGGCPPYFYNWSHDPNLSTPVATGLGAGVYEVTVTDGNGCTSDASVTIVINEPGDPIAVTVDAVSLYPGGFNVSCPDATDGSIDISITGGTPNYFITWIHQESGDTYFTEDLAGIPCGTYNLTVVDANDCEVTETVVLDCVPAWNVSGSTTPNPCGAPDGGAGAIDILVSGSHGGPYTIEWTGPSCPCTGPNLTNLDSGDYTATITDALGCSTEVTFNVGTNDSFVVSPTILDSDCGNTCAGSIELDIVPAVYDLITWTGPEGFVSNDEDIFDLCPGNYSVTIVSGNCEETFNYTVGAPSPIVIEFTDVIPPVCFGQNNGSVTANASGGVGVLSYEWLPSPDCFFPGSNQPDISNLFECEFTVVVTDETGCSETASIFLDAPQVMDIFVSTTSFDGGYNVSCFEANDGQISVSVSGGSPDCVGFAPECYNYDWSSCDPVNVPGSSFQDNLAAGTYCVLVTDANGCVATTQIPITQPDPIQSSGTISDYNGFGVSCPGECDGTITPNITGGSDTYVVYNWMEGDIGSNDPLAETLIDLCAGTYTLQIEDTNGCQEMVTFELTEPDPITVTIDNISDVSCFGASDGSIAVTANGGTGNYTFEWNEGEYFGNLINGIPAGTYDLVVTDENGCSIQTQAICGGPPPFFVNLNLPIIENGEFNIPCVGESTGTILTTIEGGIPEYQIEWTGDGIVNANSLNQQNLPAGTYTITVTDAEGCVATEDATITEPELELLVSAEVSSYPSGFEISCAGACDGFIDLTVAGGVEPYTFLWELNSDGGEFALTEDVSELCPGNYEVLVSDANGCDTLLQFTIDEPEPILSNPTLSDYGNGFNLSCADACDASIELAPTGGTPGYSFEWTVNGAFAGDLASLDGLCAEDVVSVLITDAVGCTLEETFILNAPEPIELNEVVAQIACFGEENGSIALNVTGGDGNYTYTWTPDLGNVSSIDDLAAGEYCVLVSDGNGCEVEACWEIAEPEELTVSIAGVSASCGQCDGIINLSIEGGTLPYSIEWTGPTTIDDDETGSTDLCAGTYGILVQDAAGCTVAFDYDLPGPPPLEWEASIAQPLCFGDCDGIISVVLTNATDPVNATWTDASGAVVGNDLILSELCNGNFTLEVSDAEGCSFTETFGILEPDSLTINGSSPLYDNGFNVSGFGASDGVIETELEGGTPEYTYEWSGPSSIEDGTSNPLDLVAGEYTLTITDANGCMKDTLIVLTQPDDLTLPNGFTPNGDGANDFFVILGIDQHPNNLFKVFNRWGNLVYEKSNYANEWDGRNTGGDELPDGTYFVVFEASERQFATYVDLRR